MSSLLRGRGRLMILAGVGLGLAAGFVLASKRGDRTTPREQDGQIVRPLDKAAALRIARDMDADATLKPLLADCPADDWRRRGDLTRRGAVAPATCTNAPDTCLADCLEFSSGQACFTLARVMERTPDVDPLEGQTLYALACAAGESGGCVNRGAGLRNGEYANDPFSKDRATRQACEARSFAIGCDAGGAWGCAMRGQAYELGEGVPADAAAARRDYAKACALDPKFAACKFARMRRAEMGKAAEEAGPPAPKP